MDKTKYSYHFSLHLSFKKDVDVDKLEKQFGLTAYKKTYLKDAKGPEKCAKIWFRTNDFTEVNTDEMIEKFAEKIFDKFKDLKQILSEQDGKAYFGLVFTQVKERPVIALTYKTIKMFEQLGFSFDVDFV